MNSKHRNTRSTALVTATMLVLLLSLTSCRQHITYVDLSLSAGLTARVAGTDGDYTSPASRGALITTTNFGTYYESFDFKAFQETDMSKPYVTGVMIDKGEDSSGPSFYKDCYGPDASNNIKWPSQKNPNTGNKEFIPLSLFCSAGDTCFTPTVSFVNGVSTATLADYTVPTDASEQKDCLIAITDFVSPTIEGTGEDAEFGANFYLYFSHALTAVNFEVGSITPGITIDSLTISGIDGKGTMRATHSLNSTNYYKKDDKTTTDKNEEEIIWTTDSAKNASYTTEVGFEIIGSNDAEGREATKQAIYNADGTLNTHGAMLDTTKVEAHSLILLPQKIKDAKLTIKYTYKGAKYTQTADIREVTWLRSYKYIYALNLTLQEFGFNLYVQDWTDGGSFPEEGYNW